MQDNQAAALYFFFPRCESDHPAGGIGNLNGLPRLRVNAALKVKGGADIGLALFFAVPHRTNQCNPVRAHMIPDEGLKSVSIPIWNQHMYDRDSVYEIKRTA